MKSLEDFFDATQPKVEINCPEKEGFLYRLERFHGTDLHMRFFLIVKRTEKGAWILRSPYSGKRKFVLLSARKKWACPTHKEAILSFQRRKEVQIGILNSQLAEAKEQLKTISAHIRKNFPNE